MSANGNGDEMPDSEEEESGGLRERLSDLRERVQRKQTAREADRRASARRVKRREPETASEKVSVKRKEAGEVADEAAGLASDAKTLISSEFGVSETEAEGLIAQGAKQVKELGSSLDNDGDGDTDLLEGLDDALDGGGGGGGDDLMAPMNGEDPGEPPIGEIEDDFDDIDAMDGVEAEIDLDFPIEEQN